MKYYKKLTLKNGEECIIRSAEPEDAEAVLDNFILTHAQTDNLVAYPDEMTRPVEAEAEYLKKTLESKTDAQLMCETDGKVVGLSGAAAISGRDKLKHRATFGVSVDKNYWGLGVGRALTEAAVECAKKGGFAQLELEVVADNEYAVSLYKKFGFAEYGRNPMGFRLRSGEYKTLILMRLELKIGE